MSAKRYKQREKNFLIFYVFICIFFVLSYTLSRYITAITDNSASTGIAKFNVTVNEINVTEGQPFEINLSQSNNYQNQKVAPNNTGYFEFIINPEGTEVSLEYEFKFNTEELGENFKITHYTVNNDEENIIPVEGNNVQGVLPLPSSRRAFTKEEGINVKAYWAWEEEVVVNPKIEEIDNKNIGVTAVVKQKIN